MHPKLAQQFETRDKMFEGGEIDWALGEAMAFGSILIEGTSIRLAGQDSRRGTFSHRHSTLVDYATGAEFQPLGALAEGDTNLWIYDSLLSEYAALGFEYGYSIVNEDALVLWEAQFGDFANGAQIIIDQFLVAAKDKWQQECGLTLLLPHGFEGQGQSIRRLVSNDSCFSRLKTTCRWSTPRPLVSSFTFCDARQCSRHSPR